VIVTWSIEEFIEKCKQAVIKDYEGKETTDRPWLEAHVDSYGSAKYRIQVFVLEGSPAKGYVVANYGHTRVQAFDGRGKKLVEYSLRRMLAKDVNKAYRDKQLGKLLRA
jgi:hypothetical protein